MKFINSKFKSVRTYMFIMDLERNEVEIVNTNLDQKDIFCTLFGKNMREKLQKTRRSSEF